MTTQAGAVRTQFRGLQALRFVAASSVVLHHSLLYAHERLDSSVPVWGIGAVELFFAISGFVAVVATRGFRARSDGWKYYIVRRGIRILPMYWVATTVKLAVLIVAPAAVLHATLDWGMVARSYVLLPSVNIDGDIAPLLGVAWTLLFETFFAVVFMLALVIGWRPVLVTGIILSLCALGGLLRPAEFDPMLIYFDPRLIYYILGLVVGVYAAKRSAWLFVAGMVWVYALHFILQPTRLDSLIRITVIAALLIFVMLAEKQLERLPQLFVTLGNGAYSLYLFHPLIAPAVPAAFAVIGLQVGWLAVVGSVAVAILASVLLYRFAEDPVTRWLQRVLPYGGRPPRPASAQHPPSAVEEGAHR
ncbi:acyltransferase [Agrococcus sp. ARC_14]|uniref:acyltransferase family protein n=1 Tax=Agrococcus sp. ARC_14 TaxID=2919927 RepID=UPI001F065570|nr:acyltransferase [Agrococcus sp. ARC_14]MCH1882701.1 acyltransferase [Agrococcus sp. ARC_14]